MDAPLRMRSPLLEISCHVPHFRARKGLLVPTVFTDTDGDVEIIEHANIYVYSDTDIKHSNF